MAEMESLAAPKFGPSSTLRSETRMESVGEQNLRMTQFWSDTDREGSEDPDWYNNRRPALERAYKDWLAARA
jgi:hypothetical protein